MQQSSLQSKKTGEEAKADMNLAKYFPKAKFGHLTNPTTIFNKYGKIIVWALPGVLHPNQLVRG